MTKARGRSSSRIPGRVLPAVRPIAERLAAVHGLVLWDVAFARTAGRQTLSVTVDKVGGVGTEDLQVYAEDLSRELDHTDAVPGEGAYVLDVSSPGAERKLHTSEQFRVCRGRTVHITFKDGRPPLDGSIGDLTDGDGVEIETASGAVPIRIDEIARAQLKVTGVV